MKRSTKNYNVTQLDPDKIIETHQFHRDFFAHVARWQYVMKEISDLDKADVIDFGCGCGNLLRTFVENDVLPDSYTGADIRESTIKKNSETYSEYDWAKFIPLDLIKEEFPGKGNVVVSFEVLEHVGKQNGDKFMENFRNCGTEDATYYLSTPNYDENVGAADNHTYDSGDGRGRVPQEFAHEELEELISKYFTIEKKIGAFASIKDYKNKMCDWQKEMYENCKEYFDVNVLSCIMAPFFPENSRNTVWVLKRK